MVKKKIVKKKKSFLKKSSQKKKVVKKTIAKKTSKQKKKTLIKIHLIFLIHLMQNSDNSWNLRYYTPVFIDFSHIQAKNMNQTLH